MRHHLGLAALALLLLCGCGKKDDPAGAHPDPRMARALGAVVDDLPAGRWNRQRRVLDAAALEAQMVSTLEAAKAEALTGGFEVGLGRTASAPDGRGVASNVLRFRDEATARLYATSARDLATGRLAANNGFVAHPIQEHEGAGPGGALPGWRVEMEMVQGEHRMESSMHLVRVGRYVLVATLSPRMLAGDLDIAARLEAAHDALAGE